MKELKQELKKNIFRSCYLFYGVENYLKKKYEDMLTSSILASDLSSMNLDIFSENNQQVNKIIDACETLPFMSDKRLIIIRNSEFFKAGKKDSSDMLASYISKIPISSCLLFVEDGIDKRNKLYKEVDKNGLVVDFKKLTEKNLIDWVKISFEKSGNDIDIKTAIYFVRCVGNDMQTLAGEINKLNSYKGKGTAVSIADIDSICIKSLNAKIFDLVSAIGNKKSDTALALYNNLLRVKEPPFLILTMIARQFRLMLLCNSLSNEGFDPSAISKKTGQQSFIVREILKESKNFNFNSMKSAMQDCLNCDINIKMGKMSDKLAVELLIIKYCIGDETYV